MIFNQRKLAIIRFFDILTWYILLEVGRRGKKIFAFRIIVPLDNFLGLKNFRELNLRFSSYSIIFTIFYKQIFCNFHKDLIILRKMNFSFKNCTNFVTRICSIFFNISTQFREIPIQKVPYRKSSHFQQNLPIFT